VEGSAASGRRVVELLLDDGEHVRAMVHRDDDSADQVRALWRGVSSSAI